MASSDTNDELERYKQLLQDWSASPKSNGPRTPPRPAAQPAPPPPQPAPPRGEEPPRAKLARPQAPEAEDGRFPKGTILCLDDEDLVVYGRPVAGKPFDMVFSLLADGSVKVEGIDLAKHQVTTFGRLSAADLKMLQADMRWTKHLVASNCENDDVIERIPDPAPQAGGRPDRVPASPPPQPAAPQGRAEPPPAQSAEDPVRREAAAAAANGKLRIRRGQRMNLRFGQKEWEAVYWGKDQRGSVVAHKTHGHWTLMHLDLNRFKESMVVAAEPDSDLIEEINQDLTARA